MGPNETADDDEVTMRCGDLPSGFSHELHRPTGGDWRELLSSRWFADPACSELAIEVEHGTDSPGWPERKQFGQQQVKEPTEPVGTKRNSCDTADAT